MCDTMPEVVTSAKIWQCWEVGVARLLSNDRHLLEIDASERAISHRLGMYLANEFDRWDVDCEYNRMGRDIRKKCLNTYKELLQAEGLQLKVQEQRARIYPDIIVHRRGIEGREANLLAVEIKKSSNKIDRRYDLLKLQSLRQELGYQYAAFLDIDVKNHSGIIVGEERFQ
jgi:hypothetical protein